MFQKETQKLGVTLDVGKRIMGFRPPFFPSACAALLLAMTGGHALAAPINCTPGFEDSTCAARITAAAQTPPACPASTATVGVITDAPAQWQGSHFSAPVCESVPIPGNCTQINGNGYYNTANWSWNGSAWVGQTCGHTAPPVCPSGETETTAPTWNGSSWVGQVCTLPPDPQTAGGNACAAAMTGNNLALQQQMMLGYWADAYAITQASLPACEMAIFNYFNGTGNQVAAACGGPMGDYGMELMVDDGGGITSLVTVSIIPEPCQIVYYSMGDACDYNGVTGAATVPGGDVPSESYSGYQGQLAPGFGGIPNCGAN